MSLAHFKVGSRQIKLSARLIHEGRRNSFVSQQCAFAAEIKFGQFELRFCLSDADLKRGWIQRRYECPLSESVAFPGSDRCELPANLKREINGLSGIDLANEFVKDPIRRLLKRSNECRPEARAYLSLLIDRGIVTVCTTCDHDGGKRLPEQCQSC